MKVVKIKKLNKARVINLTVHKNHTFITENGIVTHNCDNLSPQSQYAFRSLIENFAENCRFILTGNFKEKMLTPILDRLENYDFNSFSKKEMVKPIFERLQDVLKNENVTFDPKDLVPIINTYYPSIRSMIGALQKFGSSGTLSVSQNDLDNKSEYDAIVNAIKSKDFNAVINLVNEIASPDNLYTYFYKNLDLFPKTAQPGIIMQIAKYQHQSAMVRDKNLNLSACCTAIMQSL